MRRILTLLFLGPCLFAALRAQPVDDDLPQITGCIALVNARVTPAAGKESTVQNVIIRDGLITQIGPDAKIPADAYKIAADSFYVYPAFIDAFSHMGLKEPENEGGRGGPPGGGNRERTAVDAEGNATLDASGITPYAHVRSSFDPKEKSISDWRAQGFAISHVVPRGKMIPGRGAIVVLSGKNADRMLWKEDVSMYGQWTGAGGSYPSTVIGVMAKWRELYHNATQDLAHQASYNTATMVPRPQYNQAHEALLPLVKKEIPLFFRAPKVKDISRAMELQQDLGMRMVIADAEEAYMLKNQIKAKNMPLVLSLDLPEDKTEKAEKGERPEKPEGAEGSAKKDSTKVDPEKEAFEKRRAESLKAHRAQAGALAMDNIRFSFGTMSGKAGDFSKNMQFMIEQGLAKSNALNALTLEPAKMLGIDKYCGTLEVGKMANMMVTNKPLFEKETAVRYMIVEGNLYAYEIREKKKPGDKGSPDAAKGLEGTWAYTIETPEQKREGTFEFSRNGEGLTGTISSPDITSGLDELEDILVDGKKVSFTYDFDMGGEIVVVEFDLNLDGDTMEGQVHVGDIGTFPLTGKRTRKPNE